ncbi:MAG: hypothetical protein ABSE80_07730 [Halobacteriota archaeon]|jgi:hypothetical protein
MKSITAIVVLSLVIACLSVAGCTSSSSSSTVSTDYPTSGHSKLIEGAIEQVRPSDSPSSDSKTQAFTVTWINDTQAKVHIEILDTESFDVSVKNYTFTHFPSTDAATTYFEESNRSYGVWNGNWKGGPIDYYTLTGKVPTVINGNHDDWGDNGIGQFDAFVFELTSSTITK